MESSKLKILWLRERFCWMGKHSGYDQLCSVVEQYFPQNKYYSVWRDADKKPLPGSRRILRKLFIPSNANPFYDLHSAEADSKLFMKAVLIRPDIVHITYVENNLGKILKWKQRIGFKLIGTTHQPVGWWKLIHNAPEIVSGLDALITLTENEYSYFQRYLPERTYLIPHGVDTDFFKPCNDNACLESEKKVFRCVYCGKWLRDTNTMARIVDSIVEQCPQIEFDMIVPKDKRWDTTFFRIARHKQVRWQAGLSNAELRKIYQNASVLVLPIVDSTANNSLLESMACGLPIISNNVGGLKDYTRDTFADLLPVGDANGMIKAVLELAKHPEKQRQRGVAARQFAVKYLRRELVAEKTLAVYKKALLNSKVC